MAVCKHTSKDNDKHFDYQYYIACNKRYEILTKKQWLQEKFPERKEMMMIDSPHSTHAFNRFEEGHAESYKCHFGLDFKVMLVFLFLCYDKNTPSSSIKLKCINLAKKIHIQPYSWILQVGSDMIKMFHLSNQKDKLYQMT